MRALTPHTAPGRLAMACTPATQSSDNSAASVELRTCQRNHKPIYTLASNTRPPNLPAAFPRIRSTQTFRLDSRLCWLPGSATHPAPRSSRHVGFGALAIRSRAWDQAEQLQRGCAGGGSVPVSRTAGVICASTTPFSSDLDSMRPRQGNAKAKLSGAGTWYKSETSELAPFTNVFKTRQRCCIFKHRMSISQKLGLSRKHNPRPRDRRRYLQRKSRRGQRSTAPSCLLNLKQGGEQLKLLEVAVWRECVNWSVLVACLRPLHHADCALQPPAQGLGWAQSPELRIMADLGIQPNVPVAQKRLHRPTLLQI